MLQIWSQEQLILRNHVFPARRGGFHQEDQYTKSIPSKIDSLANGEEFPLYQGSHVVRRVVACESHPEPRKTDNKIFDRYKDHGTRSLEDS